MYEANKLIKNYLKCLIKPSKIKLVYVSAPPHMTFYASKIEKNKQLNTLKKHAYQNLTALKMERNVPFNTQIFFTIKYM